VNTPSRRRKSERSKPTVSKEAKGLSAVRAKLPPAAFAPPQSTLLKPHQQLTHSFESHGLPVIRKYYYSIIMLTKYKSSATMKCESHLFERAPHYALQQVPSPPRLPHSRFRSFSQSPHFKRLPHSSQKHRGYTPVRPKSGNGFLGAVRDICGGPSGESSYGNRFLIFTSIPNVPL